MKNTLFTLTLLLIFTGANAQQSSYNPLQNVQAPLPGAPKNVKPRPVIQPADAGDAGKAKVIFRDDFVSMQMREGQSENPREFFDRYKQELGTGPDDKFELLQSERDKIGYVHSRYNHYYKGIQVMESQLIMHEKDGKISGVNGKFIRHLNLNVNPLISTDEAIRLCMAADGAGKYSWESMGYPRMITDEALKNAVQYPRPSLVIMHDAGGSSQENYHTCYLVKLPSTESSGGFTWYVDVRSGEIVNKIALNQNVSDVAGTANTLYYGIQNITMDSYSGSYRLRESARPLQTLDLNNNDYYAAYLTDFTNSSTNWTTPDIIFDSVIVTSVNPVWTDNGQEDPANGVYPDLFVKLYNSSNQNKITQFNWNDHPLPDTLHLSYFMRTSPMRMELWEYDYSPNPSDSLGSFSIPGVGGNLAFSGNGTAGTVYKTARNSPSLDAHWGIEKAYDFYKNVIGRNSYNDSGAVIKSCVHFKQSESNAYWNSDHKVLLLGDGNGFTSNPWCSIDIMGHELTHAVVSSTANLTYQGEPGALNESFADIFGTAVEYYAGVSPNWLIGEKNILNPPYFLRSMSDPNSGQYPQPDTHRGDHWYPPAQSWDYGGVHINSGVQNFWFYLLCNGGSGSNDKGQPYNVPAIGMAKAEQIAYRNLVYYLTPGSDYHDAYANSMLAADDLYGPASAEVSAVRSAWWAVGLGNDPNAYCHGNTWFAWPYYSFADGSGRADYNNNSNCTWLLAPTGADSLVLVFTSFDTESQYDSVIVYDGPNENYPIVTIWWGNTVPPPITSSAGALFVRFVTDNTQTRPGWAAYYVGYGLPDCLGITTLTDQSGSFEDGSAGSNYKNNLLCGWLIAPPCATSVTLNFNNFTTEPGYDIVYVYDGNALTSPLLWSGSGSNLPPSITSTQGEMLVVFLSDYSVRYPGWSANYTSTGAPICSGVDVRTADSDVISDGSAGNNYCNNLNCGWLIQPPDVDSIRLVFLSFNLESPGENQSYGDAVEIYDGTDDTAPLLGRFAGTDFPQPVTSSGPAMFVKFYSNYSVTAPGFSAVYFSITGTYCQGNTVLTAPSGNLSDGSGSYEYGNNSDCTWLIQPAGAVSVSLTFNSFATETTYDNVAVYDGADMQSPLINYFSGSSNPGTVVSTGGSMFVRFYSDASFRDAGWDASYTSVINGMDELQAAGLKVFPNPATGLVRVYCNKESAEFVLQDFSGREVRRYGLFYCDGKVLELSLDDVADGMYRLSMRNADGLSSVPLMVMHR